MRAPSNEGALFVAEGLCALPFLNKNLFCNISVFYMIVFQALMPRGTPFLSMRRQKREKDRLLKGE